MVVAPRNDIVELLSEDHRAIRERFCQLNSVPEELRAEFTWQLTEHLVRHEVAEEVVVYPALRRIPGGSRIADLRIAEQSEAEELLARLEKLDPLTDEFVTELTRLKDAVLEHALLEEAEVFPLLSSHDGLHRIWLGERYTAAKRSAPTHPHPGNPDTPPGNLVVGPFAALLDRIRDAANSI